MPHLFEFLVALLLVILMVFAPIYDYLTPDPFLGDMKDPNEVRIELVEIDGMISCGDDEAVLDQKLRVVAVIEDNEAFVKDLKKLRSFRPLGDPSDFISGKAIMLTYPNGDIELIAERSRAFVENGTLITYFRVYKKETYFAFWERWAEMSDAVTP